MVTLYLDAGTPETGLWCQRCLKPSGIRFPLSTMTTDGVSRICTVARCTDCDAPLTERES